MEDKNNCGACYFYDHINQKERTIYCILWQHRRGQYEPCKEWTAHYNDPLHVKETRAQSIRERYEKLKLNDKTQERHRESIELTKKGFRVTKKWAIISIIIATIATIALYLIFRYIL
ncbi:MAG: hypothetical protein ISS41_11385 [Candidatus Aminicenantes bacterium]|nr:hypothetical protein [Candidatus Aminicenantes bacterium]MBL7084212.1 hypothetical protein [Candidatus Aminicenantes bacterium]